MIFSLGELDVVMAEKLGSVVVDGVTMVRMMAVMVTLPRRKRADIVGREKSAGIRL